MVVYCTYVPQSSRLVVLLSHNCTLLARSDTKGREGGRGGREGGKEGKERGREGEGREGGKNKQTSFKLSSEPLTLPLKPLTGLDNISCSISFLLRISCV